MDYAKEKVNPMEYKMKLGDFSALAKNYISSQPMTLS
jgi:hypothetical protein